MLPEVHIQPWIHVYRVCCPIAPTFCSLTQTFSDGLILKFTCLAPLLEPYTLRLIQCFPCKSLEQPTVSTLFFAISPPALPHKVATTVLEAPRRPVSALYLPIRDLNDIPYVGNCERHQVETTAWCLPDLDTYGTNLWEKLARPAQNSLYDRDLVAPDSLERVKYMGISRILDEDPVGTCTQLDEF